MQRLRQLVAVGRAPGRALVQHPTDQRRQWRGQVRPQREQTGRRLGGDPAQQLAQRVGLVRQAAGEQLEQRFNAWAAK